MVEGYKPEDILHPQDIRISDFGAWFKGTPIEYANVRNAVINYDSDLNDPIAAAALVKLKSPVRQPEGWGASFYLLVFGNDAAEQANELKRQLELRNVHLRTTNLTQRSFETVFLSERALTIPA